MKKKGWNLLPVLSFFLAIASVVFGFLAIKQPQFIFAAAICIFLSSTLKAFNHGIFIETLSLLRLAASFAIGWLFGHHAGEALGLPGILASIAGFYLLFFISFSIFGKLLAHLSANNKPSDASRLLGGFTGAFEGLFLAWIIFVLAYTFPGSLLPKEYPDMFSQFSTPIENILELAMPQKTQKAMQAIKTTQKLMKGVDPEKVDRQALNELLKPITEMPEIQSLKEDPEIHRMVNERDFKNLINHPAVKNFLENKEIQNRLMNFDWQKLDKALNKD